ncbi:[LysW]-aminoadipate kinase [Kitasatospora viridis]|uniref:N-acetylglutamate kinase n=1 Tax=Kitasatospora viridis TaxID=281105 RepID=A0A561UCJ3_9ACTN|nr:[LysW]-aminoadipate kinase [Kitasatospora viridis]TWF97094.1 N-acetylglutamate kinase [Kitasatospora viridis]
MSAPAPAGGAETVVVKCGGSGALDVQRLCEHVAELTAAGRRLVLVHGGSAEMARLAGQLGLTLRQLTAPDGVVTRYTDAATLDVLTMALAGRVKPALLTALDRHGVAAVGLTGLDAGLLRARRKKAVRAVVDGRPTVVRDDRSGRIVEVNAALLHGLLAAGVVPVVSPPALAEDGEPVNTNADRAAAAVAVALRASRLLFLTGAPGVLTDPADPASVLDTHRLPPAGEPAPPWVGGGMTIKLVAAREALVGGVEQVWIADGGAARPLAAACGDGPGTRIVLPEPAPVGRTSP